MYAAQPHVIYYTMVIQPSSTHSAIYWTPVNPPKTNVTAMGMVVGTTMMVSTCTLLTASQHTVIGAYPVFMPTYRVPGTLAYSYMPHTDKACSPSKSRVTHLYAATQVLHGCWSSSLAAPPLFARGDNRSAKVTLCIFNGFGF